MGLSFATMPVMDFFVGGIWEAMVFENTIRDYMVATLVFLAALVVLKLIKIFVVRRVSSFVNRTETHVDNAVLEVFDTIHPPFYVFVAFYGATRMLALSGAPERFLSVVLLLWVTWQVVVAIQIFLDHIIRAKLAAAEDSSRKAASGIIGGIVKIILWILGILFILSNLGVNITSLVAGLGIGGLAFALAAQKILEDLFSSLAIFFDRPFAPGDFVVIGKDKGTVQKIGIKTTRIKALSGEEVVIPNKDITSSRVSNYKRMKKRRVAFKVGVTYETDQAKLEKIPSIAEKIINGREQVEFSRTNFIEMGDSALVFEIVYHIDDREYDLYVDIQQDILLGLKAAFEKEGIEFAYPTQTVFVRQS